MLPADVGIFLRLPSSDDRRVLHPASIVESTGISCTVEIDELLPLAAGQEILVYFDRHERFLQQIARVEAVMPTDGGDDGSDEAPRLIVGIQLVGDPVSAESRQCHRVSTVTAGVVATVDGHERCDVLDVSATGFSVRVTESRPVGAVVPATLHWEGRAYAGHASVQAVDELDANVVRCGLRALDDRRSGGDLAEGQRVVSIAVQRAQLRRRQAG